MPLTKQFVQDYILRFSGSNNTTIHEGEFVSVIVVSTMNPKSGRRFDRNCTPSFMVWNSNAFVCWLRFLLMYIPPRRRFKIGWSNCSAKFMSVNFCNFSNVVRPCHVLLTHEGSVNPLRDCYDKCTTCTTYIRLRSASDAQIQDLVNKVWYFATVFKASLKKDAF